MKCTITTALFCAAGLIGGLAYSPTAFAQTLHPLNVPVFNSRPSAPATLYLDFDGDYTAHWEQYAPLTTPAYDIDGDKTTFSDQELANINQIYLRVAEAYSPFNLNITTVNPGDLFDKQAGRVVVGGDGTNIEHNPPGSETKQYWYGSGPAGGVAWPGGFANFYDNTAFVYSENIAAGLNLKALSMAIAHESGHLFGLQHQYIWPPSGVPEYNKGDSEKAPFMGTAYFAKRGTWWIGPSNLPFRIQNDVDVIASDDNGFGYYYGDDAGDSPAEAETPEIIKDVPFSIPGLITTTTDKDYYSFITTEESVVHFKVTGAQYGAMLDPDMALYDAVSGDLLEMIDWQGMMEEFSAIVPIGQYDIAVLSHGQMGDIGQYTLTGKIVGTIPEPACLSVLLFFPLLGRKRRAA